MPVLAWDRCWRPPRRGTGSRQTCTSRQLSYGSVISGLTGGSWQGAASTSMATATAPFVTWMSATAAQCEQVAGQARAAASRLRGGVRHDGATGGHRGQPGSVDGADRDELLGQNTPAIMATEVHYAQMWAQDAAAMYGYAAGSAVAATLAPFTPPKSTTNPAGLAGQTAAVAHAAGTSAGNHAQAVLSSVPQTLQGLSQPSQALSSASGLSQLITGISAAMRSAGTSGAVGPVSVVSGLTGVLGKGPPRGQAWAQPVRPVWVGFRVCWMRARRHQVSSPAWVRTWPVWAPTALASEQISARSAPLPRCRVRLSRGPTRCSSRKAYRPSTVWVRWDWEPD